MKIVVIGGTGLIGSKTVAILRQGSHEVVAASPQSGVNTITGAGLKEVMAGTPSPSCQASATASAPMPARRSHANSSRCSYWTRTRRN
jgi:predicted dinucleotide-binding enzyme